MYPNRILASGGFCRSSLFAACRVAAIVSPCCLTAAIAQTTADPKAAVEVAPILFLPTAVPTPANEVASSVTVITSRDIEAQQRRTVPDALTAAPGLNVVQTGGPGGTTSVFIRGTNANHVKVLIDGIDASDPSNPNGSFDFGQLLTLDVARIEILRGPQSGLYGADAIGGVVSVTTKAGNGPPRAVASIEGGSFGTFNQTLCLSGSSSIFNYSFNALHLRATDTPVTPVNLLPPGQAARNNYYDNWTYSTRLGADLSDRFSVNTVARYTNSKLLFTSDSGFPSFPDALHSTQINHQLYTRGEAVWKTFDIMTNTFGINYTNVWSDFKSPATFDPNTSLGERVKFDWRGVTSIVPGQTLVTGAERENDRLDTGSLVATTGNTAGYLELQSEFWHRLFVTSNVRYDENDSFGGHLTYRVAPAFIVPGTDTKLKASYGTGFKAPTLSQLYQDFPSFNFFANPNLKPEESAGYDVGFEQPVWNDRVRFGATYFHNDITNLIDFNSTFTSNANIGRATTQGAEAFGTPKGQRSAWFPSRLYLHPGARRHRDADASAPSKKQGKPDGRLEAPREADPVGHADLCRPLHRRQPRLLDPPARESRLRARESYSELRHQ